MTLEKELSFTYGYIVENFSRLFSLIDRFNILSASEDLAECNFSNIRKKTASRMMKNWTKDVSKYFESNIEKTIIAENIKFPDQNVIEIKDFSKRLNDFNNTEINSYLENIQTELQCHQNNKKILECLTLLKEALIIKQKYLKEFIKYINEKYPEQSSVS